MQGSQPHDIRSRAVNALTCALVRSLTACTLQYEVTRTSNVVAETEIEDTWPGWKDWKA